MTVSTQSAPPQSFDLALDRLERDARAGTTFAREAGLELRSHFQPIFSVSHGRVVGHEALLRASDARAQAVSPPQFFAGDDFPSLLWRDRLVRAMHTANWTRMNRGSQWLFLNMHPQVFLRSPQLVNDAFQRRLFDHFGVRGEQIVIEVLEDAVRDDADFDAAVELTRSRGCLIALDDFGAGHSNFDRVWRLKPEIVKLDRSLIARAAADASVRRVVVQMVSLLHECGALVLMEGVETESEAHVALEADADLIQGWYFARPGPTLVAADHGQPVIDHLWAGFDHRWRDEQRGQREAIAPFQNAIGYAAALLAAGHPFEAAARPFLDLPGAEVCYLLGPQGHQIGENQWVQGPVSLSGTVYAPFRDTRGARWARRPYFRQAIGSPGKVQVTRPYRTLHGTHLCITVSTAFRMPGADGGELRVVCGDLVCP
ncbi:sensor domain-containing phosphodiesterase [Caldimonas sp. KR1-144]|uniref:sensor domain-containing phosphodiesterase n=1 Tax=Caldimonas sp. KR1-144 TaxID=3400911 RepID=UPI003C0D8555